MVTKIFENKKHVFWQALFLTVMFFFLGMVLGIYFEQMRADKTNVLFYNSENSLYDSFALAQLLDKPFVSCEDLVNANINFADRIYIEARELENYDSSNKLTDSLKSIHKKYDLLRTLLWMNVISVKEKCDSVDTVVYLYNYEEEDIELKSRQVVWGRILNDLKEKEGSEIILIPIAVDQGVESLNYLLKTYGVRDFPAVLINEETAVYEHETVEELEDYLN